jgi:hypothetical protein
MFKDRFDRLLCLLLVVTVAALAGVLLGGGGTGEARPVTLDKSLEQEMAREARAALLHRIYGPVEELRKEGQPQTALLKLDELSRRYPGEAHGHILKGELLYEMGALEGAVQSFTAGVRLSGDYVDKGSPLNRRAEIRQVVEEGLAILKTKAAAQPENSSLAGAMRDVYYLQSRLAGGCE